MSVTINPGDDIAAAIAGNPDGTTFNLSAGTHRLTAAVTPKPGNSFIGVTGFQGSSLSASTLTTILSGARLLTSWTSLGGGVWSKGGQTQSGTVNGSVGDGVCPVSNPMCGYPEDLFFNNVVKKRVATLGEVAPGTWFFNLGTDTVYVGDDPTGQTVEIGVSPTAMEGYGTDITIRYLIVEKFATPTTVAPINILGFLTNMGLSVNFCEFRFNHYGGLPCNGTSNISQNYSHHNGGLGATGSGPANVIEFNELCYNGALYNSYFGAGGSKWVYSTGLIVRANWSHHNTGVGLWTDIDNVSVTYEYNQVEDNTHTGIFHEIGGACIIRYNTTKRNGTSQPFPGYIDGAGILVSCSYDTEVYGNDSWDDYQGICGLEDHRDSSGSTIGTYALTNFYVHHNRTTVTQVNALAYRTGLYDSSGTAAWGAPANNRFVANTYVLKSPTAAKFIWQGGDCTFTAWQGFSQDTAAGGGGASAYIGPPVLCGRMWGGAW